MDMMGLEEIVDKLAKTKCEGMNMFRGGIKMKCSEKREILKWLEEEGTTVKNGMEKARGKTD